MALDPHYILLQDLEELFISKDTGLLLANGTIEFWIDDQRNTPKSVYQLTGAPPNYTYTALPNPVPLNIIGTPSSDSVNNLAIYYKPYDDFGNVELYYVVVKDSHGTIQFTREAWPNTFASNNPAGGGEGALTNLLSNPQFVDVNFDPTQVLSLTVAGGGNYTFNIAPGWDLLLSTSGASTAQITRTAITGIAKLPTNPAYTLTVTPGANTTGVQLRQRLFNNPGVWTANAIDQLGWVATSISFGPQASQVIISYTPSTGTPTIIFQQVNNTGLFNTFNQTTQIDGSDNTDNSTVGYVDILITLPATNPTQLSSIQIVSLPNEIDNVVYDQQPANRQRDYLSHYYKPLLAYKPIPSFLIGWDFPMNPAQIVGDTIPATGGNFNFTIGANKAQYTWDQTIVFQTVTSSVAVSRGTGGAFTMTCHVNGQVALIQYIDQTEARKILSDRISVHISGNTTHANGLAGKVTLWATTDPNLANITPGTNNAAVTALDATGFPTMGGGNWTQVTRSLGDAYFLLQAASATNSELNDINLNGWDMANAAPTTTATYFAIVVGFAPWITTDVININSIGMCPGDIATRPAFKTQDETHRDCERWYEKSYRASDFVGVVTPAIGAVTNFNALSATMTSTKPTGGGNQAFVIEAPFTFEFRSIKRLPTTQGFPTVTIYSPVSGAAANTRLYSVANNVVSSADDAIATWGTSYIGNKFATFVPTTTSGQSVNAFDANTPPAWYITYHYVADARLGIVN